MFFVCFFIQKAHRELWLPEAREWREWGDVGQNRKLKLDRRNELLKSTVMYDD
jgi:hypothetical protein